MSVVYAEELRKATGYTQDSALMKYLKEQGIVCFPGKDGPWTTNELIELAGRVKLGLVDKQNNSDPVL